MRRVVRAVRQGGAQGGRRRQGRRRDGRRGGGRPRQVGSDAPPGRGRGRKDVPLDRRSRCRRGKPNPTTAGRAPTRTSCARAGPRSASATETPRTCTSSAGRAVTRWGRKRVDGSRENTIQMRIRSQDGAHRRRRRRRLGALALCLLLPLDLLVRLPQRHFRRRWPRRRWQRGGRRLVVGALPQLKEATPIPPPAGGRLRRERAGPRR